MDSSTGTMDFGFSNQYKTSEFFKNTSERQKTEQIVIKRIALVRIEYKAKPETKSNETHLRINVCTFVSAVLVSAIFVYVKNPWGVILTMPFALGSLSMIMTILFERKNKQNGKV